MISLYLHIPFCASKCAYCSFYSVTDADRDKYTDALVRSIKYYGSIVKDTVSTLYIGGGTPSLLTPGQLADIIGAVRKSFDVMSDAEITVEGNPESLDRDFLSAAADLGVNRLSLGVQSFNDAELAAVLRVHDSKTAIAAMERAKSAGFDNISCDLIFGLPLQTEASFMHSLETACRLGASHISCYNLQLEKGTPLYETGTPVPDEELQERMYFAACKQLKAEGFTHYEISNFAKQSMESRHNSAYWNGSDYLGLGPAAHSKLGDTRFSFNADVDGFIAKKDFGFDKSERIDDPLFEKIMLGLRTNCGIRLDTIPHSIRYADRLCSAGFAEVSGGVLRLTDRGFYLSNTIISDITAKEC